MAQSFGSVGSKMIDIMKRVAIKELVDEAMIHHRSLDESGFAGDIFPETSAQIVHHDDLMTHSEKMLGDM
jgi:hypothetical protein